MNVSLTPKLEALIAELVDAGPYRSAHEVIEQALRLLYLRDHFDKLHEDVRRGVAQLESGQARPFNRGALDRVKRQARRRLGTKRAKAHSR